MYELFLDTALECFRRRSKSCNECSGERQGRARSLGDRGVTGDPVQREEQADISGRRQPREPGQFCCEYVLTIGPVELSRGGVSHRSRPRGMSRRSQERRVPQRMRGSPGQDARTRRCGRGQPACRGGSPRHSGTDRPRRCSPTSRASPRWSKRWSRACSGRCSTTISPA